MDDPPTESKQTKVSNNSEEKNAKASSKKTKKEESDSSTMGGKSISSEVEPVEPKKSRPFYVTAKNYVTLLNLKDTIEYFGPMRHFWEVVMDKYIQLVKKELTTMCHTDQF